MSTFRRAIAGAEPGARRRWTAALLAALALLALPVSQGLALHHVDHHGTWIAADPEGVQLERPETGAASEDSCPLCLASTLSGSLLLPQVAGLPAAPAARTRAPAAAPAQLASAGDLCVAGPRAPPIA